MPRCTEVLSIQVADAVETAKRDILAGMAKGGSSAKEGDAAKGKAAATDPEDWMTKGVVRTPLYA